MPQHDDDIYLGLVEPGGRIMGTASATQMLRGIGPCGRIVTYNIGTPTGLSTIAVCNTQTVLAAGNAVLNGDTTVFNYVTGAREAQFFSSTHLSRCLQMVSTNAGDTTQSVLCRGTDLYGQRMSQIKTLNGTTPVNFTKAFKTVTQVTVSAALAGSLTVGSRDAFGFPCAVAEGGYIVKINWGNVYGPGDAGTVTTADTTNPATTSTNDVRGFYQPSSPANGATRLVFMIMVHDTMVGPNATRASAFGVTQV